MATKRKIGITAKAADDLLRQAIDEHMSEWSGGDPFDVLARIEEFGDEPVDDDELLVWDRFDDLPGAELAKIIRERSDELKDLVLRMLKSGAIGDVKPKKAEPEPKRIAFVIEQGLVEAAFANFDADDIELIKIDLDTEGDPDVEFGYVDDVNILPWSYLTGAEKTPNRFLNWNQALNAFKQWEEEN